MFRAQPFAADDRKKNAGAKPKGRRVNTDVVMQGQGGGAKRRSRGGNVRPVLLVCIALVTCKTYICSCQDCVPVACTCGNRMAFTRPLSCSRFRLVPGTRDPLLRGTQAQPCDDLHDVL